MCLSVPKKLMERHIHLISQLIKFNGYSALGPVSQEPEPSQTTGMALIHCILGKFYGVVCHCFPPHLDIPLLPPGASTSSTMREILAAKGGTLAKKCPVILPT